MSRMTTMTSGRAVWTGFLKIGVATVALSMVAPALAQTIETPGLASTVLPAQPMPPAPGQPSTSPIPGIVGNAMDAAGRMIGFSADGPQQAGGTTTYASGPIDLLDSTLDLLPNGPDLEGLRYFAKNGEHDRYRREFERLRQLYPTWSPPRDLFANPALNEQDIWDVYGENDLQRLENAIRARMEKEPGWQPTPILAQKIENRRRRAEIVAFVRAENWKGILSAVEANPKMLEEQDLELLWFVGQAFGETGEGEAALKAFRAALSVARTGTEKGATLQKAAAYLDSAALNEFINEVMTATTALDDIEDIEDGLVSGLLVAMLRAGEAFPTEFDDRLQNFIRRTIETQNQQHIELLAWAAFAAEDWEQSNRWFEMLPDDDQNPEILEGKILSYKHKGDWLVAFQKARAWKDRSADIGRLYLNLGAPYMLPQKPEKFDADFLADYARKTMELERGEGAEALGWYAYNIRQLRTAHEWFLRAAQWDETDTSAYGLVLTAREARDYDLFMEYKRLYGPVYPLVARTEFTPCGDNSPIETVYYESEEYKEWRAEIEERIALRQGYTDELRCADDIETRRVNEQRLVERLEGTDRPIAPWEVDRRDDARFYEGAAPRRQTVSRERTAAVPARPATTASTPRASAGGGGSSSALLKAQANGDYISCLRISDQLIRSGRATAKDHETRGWCLMGANRPTEAERAFATAGSMGAGGNASYGETLAQLRNGKTNDAHTVALNTNMSADKRREIDIEVLTQRARAAYQRRDYQSVLYALDERRQRTPETRDLMLMRGWSLYKLGFTTQAHQLMRAIDSQYSTSDSRQAVSATAR